MPLQISVFRSSALAAERFRRLLLHMLPAVRVTAWDQCYCLACDPRPCAVMPSDDVQLGSPDGVVGCRVHGLSLDLALERAWSSELDPEQTRRSLDSRVLGPGPGRDMVECFR